ncbi:MAG: MerR family transcriptional regulator [Candidatus Altiarchaeales archaeon]|nr:MerR family transcriptional regulator [Candidatus Altiarchaeales archaeon]
MKYGIKELSELGGVSRRTIRYYVQQGLLPKPTGTGRGKHYTQEHLDTLLEIRAAQETGKPLEEIKKERLIAEGVIPPDEGPDFEMSAWVRVTIENGIELHLRRSRAPDSKTLGKVVEGIRLLVAEHMIDVNKRSR